MENRNLESMALSEMDMIPLAEGFLLVAQEARNVLAEL